MNASKPLWLYFSKQEVLATLIYINGFIYPYGVCFSFRVIVIHFHNGLFVIHSDLEMGYFYFICTQAAEFTVLAM